MRVPISWLREYVDMDLTPEALAERLTVLGMEVKELERRGDDWRGVVVGELLRVEKHPNADRLSLATVTLGSGEPLEIVCGATNIAAGQRVPVALPGAVLPGNRRIERAEKMGVVSNGMLCSGKELHLTGDGDGILILPQDAPLGVPLADLYGDVVLDVDVKPNRGDALSMIGLAREVSAVTGAPVRWPSTDVAEAGRPVTERLAVEVRDPDLCARFVGRWAAGVEIGPSPDLVQMRLIAAGMRPVSNVVDASNYVMLELGKPIHTFDAATVREGRIVVRRAFPGERLETLDHVVRELTPETLLIADPVGPLGIAGVMGGAGSEIGLGTRDVIIESAIFDPVSIRRTGIQYGLRSEASLRFEKGQEFRLARIGADRCARLIAEWARGSVAPGRVDTAPDEPAPAQVAFRPARVNRLLGTAISPGEQRDLLARVGIETDVAAARVKVSLSSNPKPLAVEVDGDTALIAFVPTWRRDISIEADVAEEVARVRGYELAPGTLPATLMPPWRPNPLELRDDVRATLAGAGLTEVVTHALVSPRHLETFAWTQPGPAAAGEGQAGGSPLHVTNPLSSEHSVMRQGLVGSLLDVVSTNIRQGTPDMAIFEVGKGYGRDGERPREWWRLGLALTGEGDPSAWNRPARPADLDDVQGIVELLATHLGLGRPEWQRLEGEPILHPGRAASVIALTADGRSIGLAGRVGQLHPAILDRWEVRAEAVIVAELSIAGLTAGRRPVVRATPPPRFPSVERDLAIVVADAVPASSVEAAIRAVAGELLRTVVLFDVYRGVPLGTGEKSLAYRLTFARSDRTLMEDEVDRAIDAVAQNVARTVGGRIRA
jgi:phenylalanyl-tRNA synthetase beta chain